MRIVTRSVKQTQRAGELLAKEIKNVSMPKKKRALVIGLEGELGSGKTTFIQGFAKGLGVKEKILSPTFVILKRFELHKHDLKNVKCQMSGVRCFRCFYHLDCYRLDSPKDLFVFGFRELLKNPENIVLIEWADKVRKILPRKYLKIKFSLVGKNERKITVISNF